ncbi:hypothetical protein L9G16_06955 [Shewanella sp. A25]|nr:hypothetical protein [Shewanella shenzhenensis]
MLKIFIVIFLLFSVGCGSSDEHQTDSNLEPVSENKIEDIEFAHPAMKQCLLYWADLYEWKTIEDVTMFSCSKNGIDSIEGLSQLTNLQNLTLTYTALTELDLSSLPHLNQIKIMNNPRLSKVNLSQNLELTRVFVNYNAVKEIDISNLPNLVEVNFTTNLLENIKLDGTTINHISLGGNPIKNIDFSVAKSIKDVRLQGCPLESLDISDLLDLEILFIDETGLSSVDISNNRELQILSAPGNKISNIRFYNNPKLVGVGLENNPLDEDTKQYLSTIDWINVLNY